MMASVKELKARLKANMQATREPQDRAYQRTTIREMTAAAKRNRLVWLDTGLGKTFCAITAYIMLRLKDPALRLLVVSKANPIAMTWPQELTQWAPELSVVLLNHPDRRRVQVTEDHDAYLISYELLPWFTTVMRRAFKRKFILCLDESSSLRNDKTVRFKKAEMIKPMAERQWQLTATPNPKGYHNLWAQVYLADGKRVGTTRESKALGLKGEFLSIFFSMHKVEIPGTNQKFPVVHCNRANQAAIQKRIKHLVIRFDHGEIRLPRPVPSVRRIQLGEEARARYREMERHYVIEEFDLLAASAGVKSMKLRQIANGAVYDDLKNTIPIHEHKLDELEALAEELEGQQLLVGYEFQHDIDRILQRKRFKRAAVIGSGTSKTKRLQYQDDWNANRLPFLFCQIESASFGLNLQKSHCKHIALFALTWNTEAFIQFLERVIRSGNLSEYVIVHYLVAEDTVDEDVITTLQNDQFTQQGLLNAMLHRTAKSYGKLIEGELDMGAIPATDKLRRHIVNSGQQPPTLDGKTNEVQNFYNLLMQRIGAWMPGTHERFLEDITGKAFTKQQLKLSQLYQHSKKEVFKLFKFKTDEADKLLSFDAEAIKQFVTEQQTELPLEETQTMSTETTTTAPTPAAKRKAKVKGAASGGRAQGKTAAAKPAPKKKAATSTAKDFVKGAGRRASLQPDTSIKKGPNAGEATGVHAKMMAIMPAKTTVKGMLDICAKKLDHKNSKEEYYLLDYMKYQLRKGIIATA